MVEIRFEAAARIRRAIRSQLGPCCVAFFAVASLHVACSSKVPRVTARQITSRSDLIGGPGSLGDVGDYLLANERIRVVVQGAGYSRGFGIYGGSLIDADLVRPQTDASSAGSSGYDNFSELFPSIFLKAVKPSPNGINVKEYEDGSGAASIIVTGGGEELLFVAEKISDIFVDADKLTFQNEYKLFPGKPYIEITTTVINRSESEVRFPAQEIPQLPEGEEFVLPVGDVILFGEGNRVFAEPAGFDIRFTLERLYENPPGLPRLPGLITPFLATRGEKVSYGFLSGVVDPEESYGTAAGYDGAEPGSLLVPFFAQAFTQALYGSAKPVLGSREHFAYKKYFIVGSGDVASVRDVVHEIRDNPPGSYPTGMFAGIVRDERTLAPETGVDVIAFDAAGSPYNQHTTDENGSFRGTYAPGRYSYRVLSSGRYVTDPVDFEVLARESTVAEIFLPPPGLVAVRIRGEDGRLLPARCTLVGQYPRSAAGFDPKEFLYDLRIGEEMRPTDLVPDGEDPGTREFIEHVIYAPAGQKTDRVRPGSYRAVCSRGLEYDTSEREIVVRSGQLTEIDVVLEHVVHTEGWVSGDYHLHSINSVDSFMKLEDRVAQVAIEGVDIACSSDHNYVTDFGPTIARLGLEGFVQGMIGLELTTLEIGHFNGFPLRYDPGPITKGSFEWSKRTPGEIMKDLRALGRYGPGETVVQVNHPRDTILGYFTDYGFNPDTGLPEDGTSLFVAEGPEFGSDKFDFGFDALEIFNGKRFDLLHTYRVPETLPPAPIPENAAELIPGAILRDSEGKVAFPGGLEDWYTLLNRGFIYTAMANSDSHGAYDEVGIPRTFTPVTNDVPGTILEPEVISAIKNQRALLTNGPFVRVSVTGASTCRNQKGEDLGHRACGMGEVVSGKSGGVTVNIRTEMAPWITIDRISIIRDGEVVRTVRGDKSLLAFLSEDVPVARDGFIVVEVSGSDSMWPVISPLEVPSLQISDALGTIGSAFGVNLNPFGNLSPQRISAVHSFAFTNPIFIDADGDGFFTPQGARHQALVASPIEGSRAAVKRFDARRLPVLVKLFGAFAGHGH